MTRWHPGLARDVDEPAQLVHDKVARVVRLTCRPTKLTRAPSVTAHLVIAPSILRRLQLTLNRSR